MGGSISGHVYKTDDITLIAGAWVNIELQNAGYWFKPTVLTASDGSYTFTGLADREL